MEPYYVRQEDVTNENLKTYMVTQERGELEHYKLWGMKLYLDATSSEHSAVFYWRDAPVHSGDKVAATAQEFLEQNTERPKLMLNYPTILRGDTA